MDLVEATQLQVWKFERERDVASLVKSLKGYSVKDNIIYYEGKEVARSYKKHSLYKYLSANGIDWKK